MRKLLREIGSLTYLSAFEASARHLSFSRAAEELNVSQPAISRSVRNLEDALGVALFLRKHRAIALTDAGAMLAHEVSEAFGRVHSTVAHLSRLGASDHVTLSVSTAFANYWVVPRLQALHARHPGVDLRLQTTDKELDLAAEGISLGVRRGAGVWPGYEAALIAPERLFAVASPKWIDENPAVASLADLTTRPLIHLEEPFRQRLVWRDFFAAFGVDYRDPGGGLRLNDYALVLQAAMAGEGVAMGYEHVTETIRAQGLVARVGDWSHETGKGFYLVWSANAALSENARIVRDWIVSHAPAV